MILAATETSIFIFTHENNNLLEMFGKYKDKNKFGSAERFFKPICNSYKKSMLRVGIRNANNVDQLSSFLYTNSKYL